MASSQWKYEERKVAKMFRTERRLMKGTSEKSDIGGDDFPLVLDVKLWKESKWELRRWFREVFDEARRQDKIPVVSVRGSGMRTRYSMICFKDLSNMIVQCPGVYKSDSFYVGNWTQKKWRIRAWYTELTKTANEERPGAIPVINLDGTHIHTEIGALAIIRTEHLAELFLTWRAANEKPATDKKTK